MTADRVDAAIAVAVTLMWLAYPSGVYVAFKVNEIKERVGRR